MLTGACPPDYNTVTKMTGQKQALLRLNTCNSIEIDSDQNLRKLWAAFELSEPHSHVGVVLKRK
ncbi:hypothetical protein PROAA_460029 [Candidatus Propionivibrio aalborgensis]|uniref:Uncharacterized protein n=1 Tax=Candidatus Propionivibrio aalborgensis TaxID=1860101 RepID=A0A1A8XZQ6_9RHOO|nr:hypothetical protein PROAA_460029 [Candidatus Propionivibrio aalborgensis]